MNPEYLRQILLYDPETGIWTWLKGRRTGSIAGTITNTGYRQIMIDKVCYLGHRLAYFYMTGEWPEQVDHANCDRSDDRWVNLRNATHSQNKMNTPIQKNNTTGYKGVIYDSRRDKYYVRIKCDGISYFFGYYGTAIAASEVYIKVAGELHGEFANV